MSTDLEQEEAKGQTVERPVGEGELSALKALVDEIRNDIGNYVQQRRQTALETRLCRWDGQSDDGRKHKDDLGKDALPFEGASDARVRLADKTVNERVAEYETAVMRGSVRFTGLDGLDQGKAARWDLLRRWLIGQWGDEFRRQVQLLGQYQEGDSPGVAVALVDWHTEWGLEARDVTREEALAWWAETVRAQGNTPTEEDLVTVQAVLADRSQTEAARALVSLMMPQVSQADATRAARDLAVKGVARMAVRYARRDGPTFRALRLYEDVFFPANTRDPQRCRMWTFREWLTRAEVQERAATEKWNAQFVVELIGEDDERGQEGVSGFDQTYQGSTMSAYDEILKRRSGLYEVLTSLDRAVTPDGAIGIFERKWSYFCATPATPRRLFDRKHGKYPVVVFTTENLTDRLIDSRGVPERAFTDQTSLKTIRDAFDDHVQRNTNPPLLKPDRMKYSLQRKLAPFGEIEIGLREKIEPLHPPPYPRAALDMMQEIRREADDYFGRKNDGVADEVVLTLRQQRVDRFLAGMGEVFKLALQLCQQYMTAEQLARVIGQKGAAETERSMAEIQGQFDVQIYTDVRDWDAEYVVKKTKMLLDNVRPMDVRGVLPWEQFAALTVAAIDPRMAELIPPDVTGTQRVVEDEQAAYGKILLGIRPAAPDWIENPELRLQTLSELHAPRLKNPAAFQTLTPASLTLLDERVKYLSFQGQQMENAAIGRRGMKETDLAEVEPEEAGGGPGEAAEAQR